MSANHPIKKIFPLRLIFFVKNIKSIFAQEKIPGPGKKKRIYFMDAADYGNTGDLAIRFAICRFAAKHFPEYELVELEQRKLGKYLRSLKKNLRPDDMIFLTGGGNMGNIYRMYEANRRVILSRFRKNRTVVFPQTLYYSDDVFGRNSIRKSQKVYGRHANLVLCAREEKSFCRMRELYPSAEVILCPDMVLSLSDYAESFRSTPETRRVSAGICIRNDFESALSKKERVDIISAVKRRCASVKKVSAVEKSFKPGDDYGKLVTDKLKETASCGVLVTDRLHPMIFAALVGTPCIALRSRTGKTDGTLKIIEGNGTVRAQSAEDVEIALLRGISSNPGTIEALRGSYEELAKAIRG